MFDLQTGMKISVVVCAYNEEKLLNSSLNSLFQQDYPKEFYEIIIVDDESTDMTGNIAIEFIQNNKERMDCQYVLIKHGGLSVARNIGIEKAKYGIVAFIDGDAIASANWLQEISNTFRKYPEVSLVGGIVENLNSSSEFSRFIHHLHYVTQNDRNNVSISKIIGTNMSYRKDVFIENGGFYHLFKKRGDETTVNKIINKKNKYIFNPEIIVKHERPVKLGQWLKMRYENGYYGFLSSNVVNTKTNEDGRYLVRFFNKLLNILFYFVALLLVVNISIVSSILFIITFIAFAKRHFLSKELFRLFKHLKKYDGNTIFMTGKGILFYLLGCFYDDIGWIRSFITNRKQVEIFNNLNIGNIYISKIIKS